MCAFTSVTVSQAVWLHKVCMPAVTDVALCRDLIKPSSWAQCVSSSMQCTRVCIIPSVQAPKASPSFLILHCLNNPSKIRKVSLVRACSRHNKIRVVVVKFTQSKTCGIKALRWLGKFIRSMNFMSLYGLFIFLLYFTYVLCILLPSTISNVFRFKGSLISPHVQSFFKDIIAITSLPGQTSK